MNARLWAHTWDFGFGILRMASRSSIIGPMTFFQFREKVYGFFFGKKPRRNPFNFEVHLNDHCNLNCKSCFHFAPLAKPDSRYPLDQFEQDIKRLCALFDGTFGWVHLLGGEPLLNPDILRYLEIVGANIQKGQVDIITNGILLHRMDDAFFKTCRQYGIGIAVTAYPIELDYEKLRGIVEGHGCRFTIFGDRGKEGFSFPSLRQDSRASAKKRYLSCVLSNACVTLERGKLYYCSLPAYVHLFNERFGDTFRDETDAISIYDNDKEAVLDFLRSPHGFCRYCDIKHREKKANLLTWGRSDQKKEEWMFPSEKRP